MAPKSIYTDEQLAFFDLWMPEFLVKQTHNQLAAFWIEMRKAWLTEWPEETSLGLPVQDVGDVDPDDATAEPPAALTDEQRAMLDTALATRFKQLRTAFYNGHAKLKKKRGGVGRSSSSLAAMLFKSRPRRRRRHQVLEVYQRDFLDKIRKALNDTEFDQLNEAASCRDEEGEWIDDDDDLWDEESEEVKAIVRKTVRDEVLPMIEVDDDEKVDRSAEEYQLSIDESTRVAEMFLAEFGRMTGWMGVFVYGGPIPRLQGQLGVKAVSFGSTPDGRQFDKWHPNFKKRVTDPLLKFLRQAIPREVRLKRAIFTGDEDSDDEERENGVVYDYQAAVAEPAKKDKDKAKSKSKSKTKSGKAKARAQEQEERTPSKARKPARRPAKAKKATDASATSATGSTSATSATGSTSASSSTTSAIPLPTISPLSPVVPPSALGRLSHVGPLSDEASEDLSQMIQHNDYSYTGGPDVYETQEAHAQGSNPYQDYFARNTAYSVSSDPFPDIYGAGPPRPGSEAWSWAPSQGMQGGTFPGAFVTGRETEGSRMFQLGDEAVSLGGLAPLFASGDALVGELEAGRGPDWGLPLPLTSAYSFPPDAAPTIQASAKDWAPSYTGPSDPAPAIHASPALPRPTPRARSSPSTAPGNPLDFNFGRTPQYGLNRLSTPASSPTPGTPGTPSRAPVIGALNTPRRLASTPTRSSPLSRPPVQSLPRSREGTPPASDPSASLPPRMRASPVRKASLNGSNVNVPLSPIYPKSRPMANEPKKMVAKASPEAIAKKMEKARAARKAAGKKGKRSKATELEDKEEQEGPEEQDDRMEDDGRAEVGGQTGTIEVGRGGATKGEEGKRKAEAAQKKSVADAERKKARSEALEAAEAARRKVDGEKARKAKAAEAARTAARDKALQVAEAARRKVQDQQARKETEAKSSENADGATLRPRRSAHPPRNRGEVVSLHDKNLELEKQARLADDATVPKGRKRKGEDDLENIAPRKRVKNTRG
ncbi:hypothetical protein B0H15DRAFT_947477 [Mycena belliarum]|uniref:Uncharacterized protein n=1 Tax=Mycena belliarum TaxID=1033014 RepID=A0AAD6UC27_9AGAR|nr:hypothetical protein B0H15DRAFT_947477 [Mycena belliae]